MTELYSLTCPIRGKLKNSGRSKDGLTPNEEYQRVRAIKYLIAFGYPKANFRIEVVQKRFGNNGRNSFRCDFVVLDVRACDVSNDVDEVLKHAVLLCEVKRDSSKESWVKQTQVSPMLDFAKRTDAVGLFWSSDSVRVFWHTYSGNKIESHEASLSALPKFGNKVQIKPLTYSSIGPCPSLLNVFAKIEDVLHGAGLSKERRYEVIFQLLLAKIFDEHAFETRTDDPLEFQDFNALGISAETAYGNVSSLVKKAVNFYQTHLPNEISVKLNLDSSTLSEIVAILAPYKITASNRDVVQTFYMKFAKDLYKWDMAQYFTPTRISDFVVEIINPQFGELTCDPACGSADFLVGTFRYGKQYNPGYADSVFGFDSSSNAVQVAVLNMVLNGDGKSNIKQMDSLISISEISGRFDVVICNPPFGAKIVERRSEVLSKFDLGHSIKVEDGQLKIGELESKQELGILFAEACVRLCRKTGGRIALILPNGYLGNTSSKFRTFREWLLRKVSIAAIIALPRFAFKSSGADVSASIVFMDSLEQEAKSLKDLEDSSIAFQVIDKLGWSAGNKRQETTYLRDQSDGALMVDAEGNLIVDADFEKVRMGVLNSAAALDHPWLLTGRRDCYTDGTGWAIPLHRILNSESLSLDPKYWCEKNQLHLSRIQEKDHYTLGDIADVIQEGIYDNGKKLKIKSSEKYNYIDISHISNGSFWPSALMGWQLPSRAKHLARPKDIFVGGIWSSVDKWFVVPDSLKNGIVTNGCKRIRMKVGSEECLTDLVAYLTTESWNSQMRGLATGSDGLAEIPDNALLNIKIPKLSDKSRKKLQPYINRLIKGTSTLADEVAKLNDTPMLGQLDIEPRYSHINLV